MSDGVAPARRHKRPTQELHEELDTQHKMPRRPQTVNAPCGRGPTTGAARLGRAALQNRLLEFQDALVDVEGVRHDDGVRDALPVVLSE